ncbi:MAG TPA: GNAT family N-acetyltransferase [Candidatus Agrococcus pullicola]|uniref:GNAT family N-acetyltransferase n=1 Tax=Candidatus Agrococcus pullicola TaxID=2838429 RepID=A0A9D1YTN3_9MICO|nr:GNAT family N-acetyltransferase [Candidatus Agrococcus pullicola]
MSELAGPTLPVLGKRVVLTALRESDIERTVEACTTPDAERFLDTPWPYERSDAEFFIRTFAPGGWRGEHDERVWAIREAVDGELCGVISLRDGVREVGFWLHPDAQGRGLMSDALRALVGHAEECLAWQEVRWRCRVGNTASMRVAKATGFAYLGVREGEWRDGERGPEHFAVKTNRDVAEALPWPTLE